MFNKSMYLFIVLFCFLHLLIIYHSSHKKRNREIFIRTSAGKMLQMKHFEDLKYFANPS